MLLNRSSRFHILLLFTLLLFCNNAFASHYRAGEITYSYISGRTYEITAITYTDPTSPADPNTASIVISFGDQKSETVHLSSSLSINSYIKKNIYKVNHTYQAEGNYIISLTDQNRVNNIVNINFGYSDNTAFYVETLLRIDKATGINRSPVLLIPPIDKGCEGFIYIHNPGAYDPDGDSLTYELVPPQQGTNQEVPNYETPAVPTGGSISIDYNTGELVWNTPVVTGLALTYNIAIKITEWRGRTKVGYVVRDMQIRIESCINSPPVIAKMSDYCVQAGDLVQFNVSASDPNAGQKVMLEGFGAPFAMTSNPATLNLPSPPTANPIVGQFSWRTECNNIRYEKYQALIKATDIPPNNTPLSDIRFSTIKVIGPAPLNVKVKQVGNGFNISWRHDTCGLATYYKIYKRIDSSHWNPTQCFTGVEKSLFTLLDSVSVIENLSVDTSYYDDNNGTGLSPLINYCYRIVAVYPPRDGSGSIIISKAAESYASQEVCGVIIRSKPIITNVSVNNTNTTTGAIKIKWIKPDILDTNQYLPPYYLIIKRALSLNGNYLPFDTIKYSSFSLMTDSSTIDTLINTSTNQFFYKIDFISMAAGNNQFIDASPIASSVRAAIYSTDRANILSWNYSVPWTNTQFVIYRKNNSDLLDSIASTQSGTFTDTGLVNNTSYCYIIKSVGSYSSNLYNKVLENLSQEICGTPIDTIRPCAPILTLTPPCNSFNDFSNKLDWIPQNGCANDVVYYRIYYKRLKTDPYLLLDTLPNTALQYSDTSYMLKKSIAGCYVVVGVDSFNNESYFTNEVCTDNCPEYRIPNVFTPQGDGANDILHPFPYRFVDKIDLIIYNRWGSPVYETNNLDINWDGKAQDSKEDCSDGVYFYLCDVYEIFLEGVKKRTIRGTIQIIR